VGLNFDGMITDIQSAPSGSVILLHGCAHNPTGVDPTQDQWAKIADAIEAKGHMVFFDVAYQGFATGSLDADAFAPRYFASRGIEFLVAQSYSKNLGLYGERVGALSAVLSDASAADRALSQMKRIARAIWSNPPAHGARIVAEVVGDSETFGEWKDEMAEMAGRIADVRKELHGHLTTLCPERNWDFVLRQIGMFSFTGMTPVQVENMTGTHSVFMTKDGRISLAGLNKAKSLYLAEAIVDSVRNH
jgi:aspartate aminotransferase, chloroplastic